MRSTQIDSPKLRMAMSERVLELLIVTDPSNMDMANRHAKMISVLCSPDTMSFRAIGRIGSELKEGTPVAKFGQLKLAGQNPYLSCETQQVVLRQTFSWSGETRRFSSDGCVSGVTLVSSLKCGVPSGRCNSSQKVFSLV